MPTNDYTGPEAELTRSLIGMAMKVHSCHGPGLDEKAYENSICIEMAEILNFAKPSLEVRRIIRSQP
ncbi:GxxExxY protein [Haloferula chungangensis]|uniref:GxxExxY protein n=1 Tax=Haloferula chungangensis TaxID=1048331 RepID=A0ABW2L1E3_9BACT